MINSQEGLIKQEYTKLNRLSTSTLIKIISHRFKSKRLLLMVFQTAICAIRAMNRCHVNKPNDPFLEYFFYFVLCRVKMFLDVTISPLFKGIGGLLHNFIRRINLIQKICQLISDLYAVFHDLCNVCLFQMIDNSFYFYSDCIFIFL